ncbi:MAG: DUF3365 domain-containing protein [Gammaproteobacteria bacterium]|nr:DUF3365 domain-containing protein [Gammaproteobacteria bacterium]
MNIRSTKAKGAALTLAAIALTACTDSGKGGISPQDLTDMLHLVMESDRAVYTKQVVNRLAKDEQVIKASEHFMDEKALPLPAQMFRFGAETVAGKTDKFSYSLQSLWPINKQNAPRTDLEKTGLKFVVDNPGQNFYGEETLGDVKYFTAVYADVAVAPVCASCHNEHKDTPRKDFKIGDVMGGVVIRVPMGS